MEVHQAGGGINFTVEKTRSASEDELLILLNDRLQRMLKSGFYFASYFYSYILFPAAFPVGKVGDFSSFLHNDMKDQ